MPDKLNFYMGADIFLGCDRNITSAFFHQILYIEEAYSITPYIQCLFM